MQKRIGILAAVVVACLCGSALAEDEMVANPAYAAWAKYKIGTTKTMKMSMEMTGMPNGGMKRDFTTTQTLSSIADDKIVVEVKSDGGMRAGAGPTKMEIPAKIEKSKVDGAMTTRGGKVSNVTEGTDKLEINGKSVDVKTKEMDIETQGGGTDGPPGKGHIKLWLTEDVPGGVAKMTNDMTMERNGASMHIVMTQTLDKFELGK